MEISKSKDDVFISDNSYVTVTDMGHIVEIQHMTKKNRTNHIRKVDADSYVDLATGELKSFKKSNHRGDSENSLKQTFKKMRYLINHNFKGRENELFVTLTYRKQTRDHIQVGNDYNNFLKRIKRKFKSQTTIDAIRVLEPHASGCFHLHVLFRFNDLKTVYVSNEELSEIWGLGFVNVQSLVGNDNIGVYLTAYLSDIEVPDDYEVDNPNLMVKDVRGENKKFVKGARLVFYPPGVNIYTKTKGVIYPSRDEMTYSEAKKIVGAVTPHYKQSIELVDEEKGFSNTITYEHYNLKRN